MQEVQQQLVADMIEPATFEWTLTDLFESNKDGLFQFRIDYHRLTQITIKDIYPLFRIDECIDPLGLTKSFNTLDFYSGYQQVLTKKQDKDKTAFVCHAGLYP